MYILRTVVKTKCLLFCRKYIYIYTRKTPSEFSSWAQLSSASSERYDAPYKLLTLDRSFSRNSARALFKLSAFHLSAIHLCRCVEKLASSSGRVGQRETPTETACIWLKLFKCLKKNGMIRRIRFSNRGNLSRV